MQPSSFGILLFLKELLTAKGIYLSAIATQPNFIPLGEDVRSVDFERFLSIFYPE
jgi:hypothetical protein